jgi:adenylate kinase family enzyme
MSTHPPFPAALFNNSPSTEVGRHAEDIVAQGKLLPDDVMLKIVTSKLDHIRNKVRARLSYIRFLC